MDPETGLVKKEAALSGARDNVRQESGFYDNIIAYATAKDAAALGLSFPCPAKYPSSSSCDFAQWKKSIRTAFWRDENGESGLFIDDLSANSLREKTFTGEAFLALPTGFLDIVGIQFTQPATSYSIGPWKKKFNQLPGPTILERFKNLTTGLIAKTSAFNSLPNFDGLKVSDALPAG